MQGLEPWRGDGWGVDILYSEAGVASTYLAHDLASGRFILVDVGPGAVRDLLDRKVWLPQLQGIFLTHGHADHMGGLYAVLSLVRLSGREDPLPIAYPSRCREVIQTLDLVESIYGQSLAFPIERHPLESGDRIELLDITITAHAALHRGTVVDPTTGALEREQPLQAFSPTLERAEQRVLYSGDCAYHDGLVELVRGADLALIEGTYPWEKAPLHEVHCTLEEAQQMAPLAKESRIIHRIVRKRPW